MRIRLQPMLQIGTVRMIGASPTLQLLVEVMSGSHERSGHFNMPPAAGDMASFFPATGQIALALINTAQGANETAVKRLVVAERKRPGGFL